MSNYSISNSKSRTMSNRVPLDDYEHLEKKAKANPANKHNTVGTEVNALIAADAEYTRRTGKFRFTK